MWCICAPSNLGSGCLEADRQSGTVIESESRGSESCSEIGWGIEERETEKNKNQEIFAVILLVSYFLLRTALFNRNSSERHSDRRQLC